ncbi:four helix bundle protein [Patescibacteria group bacterium]|nr:four helix bundle protein [Patescibacteria group bacterium]
MFYQNMPLYLKLVTLLKTEYVIFNNLPKAYKFSLGQEIVDRTWHLIDLFLLAQMSNGASKRCKLDIVQDINTKFEQLKLRLRFLTELKLVSLGQATAITQEVVEIGKMIGSWHKNLETPSSKIKRN